MLRRVGRNLVIFQQIEYFLKFLLSSHQHSGTAETLQAKAQAECISTKTLGILVEKYKTEILHDAGEEVPEVERPAGWFSFSYRLSVEKEFLDSLHNDLKVMTDERNALVHHFLPRWQPGSDEAMAEALAYLDTQREKVFNASEALEGVKAYKSLAAFIELPEIQDEILELDVVANLPALRVAFKSQEDESNEVSYLLNKDIGEMLYGRTVYSRSIPDDNNEGMITSYGEPTELSLDYDDLHYFGNGEFGLPFEFDMTVSITYYIFKSDFYLMDEDQMPSVSDHNDHYFEAESEIDIHVEGLVKLKIDPSLLKEISAEVIEENLEASIDTIDKVSVIE